MDGYSNIWKTTASFGIVVAVFGLSWIFLYFFAPVFVRYQVSDTGCDDTSKPDPVRCLIYSLLIVVIVMLLVYLFRSCTPAKRY